MRKSGGFTLIEVIIVITVLSILLTMVAFMAYQSLPRSRDTERQNDIASIARRLEQAYAAQEVGGPSYPSTTQLLNDIANGNGTVARLGTEAIRAPKASASSVVAATSNSLSTPKGAGSPILNDYVYQPLTNTNALCTGTSICVRFFLYYRTETDGIVMITKSMHQQ